MARMSRTHTEYILDSSSGLGRAQLRYLETMLDIPTTECLGAIGVRPGQRCLDLGAGGGSITRWLAEKTCPAGTVVSVDLDIDHLVRQPGVEIHRHDINDGLPAEGPYDVIHARLLLMHLSRREEILKILADALAPGGWLVVGEFSARRRHVLASPGRADAELFDRVQDIGHNIVAHGAGISMEWAHEIDGLMAAAGLVGIHGQEFSQTTSGGTPGCLLHRNYIQQLETPLLNAGITPDELTRYGELMLDPRFRAWFYQFVCTRGQKPV
jgi:SAM-dependent methyltransferase